MKKIVLMLSLMMSLMGISILAHASLDDFLESVNIQARADKSGFSAKLSAQFGIPGTDVKVIVGNVSEPADAFMVLQLSQMTHRDPTEVLHIYQRHKGEGWGRMAQRLGVKPGSPEFHALKRGDLSFEGRRGENESGYRESEHGRGGKEHGREHGNGRGKGNGMG